MLCSSIFHSLPRIMRLPSRPGGGEGKRKGEGEQREVSVSVFKWGQAEERQGHLVLSFLIIITPHLVSSDFELWGKTVLDIDYIQKNLTFTMPLRALNMLMG